MSNNKSKRIVLPPIPDKRYFSVHEACQLCGVKAYVLRFWEKEFPQLEPTKRRGRRYYQQKDIELVRKIRSLLYEQGFTIPGARQQLKSMNSGINTYEHIDNNINMKQELDDIIFKLEQLVS